MCELVCWAVHLKGGPKRPSHAAVAVGHKVYSFGGYRMVQLDVHVFNTVSLRWMSPPGGTLRGNALEVPSMRDCHTAVLIDNIVYIWGGFPYTWEFCNVVYAFDVNVHRWLKPNISGTVPEARWDHSACVLGKVMYIFGGSNLLTGCTNDIYKLDTTTMVWSLIIARGAPVPVSCHSATIIGTKMFVYGGNNNYNSQSHHIKNSYNNIRVFDTETNCWLSTPPVQLLPEVCSHQSAFAHNGELYIFGGHKNFWKLNPETFSWKKVQPKGKGPCRMSRMSCKVGDRIILFGGSKYAPIDLYVLDLNPSLKTFCKLAVTQHGLEQSELPHDIRWELVAMTTNNRKI